MTVDLDRLNHLEKMALRNVRAECSRTWKKHLRAMWEKGQYPGYEKYEAVLQVLRNASYFGPDGLDKVRDHHLE